MTPFNALIVLVLCVAASVGAEPSKVSPAGNGRARPLFGYGNEFVFQTNSDSGLNSALVAANSEISRFPGGTPSDYWLWSDGWINASSDRSGCSHLPVRPTTVDQLHTYLTKTNQNSVLVLNQLQANVSYELRGLHAHQDAGTPVKFIELGNEMYDATRPDVLEKYPKPSDYAESMADWTRAIKQDFPGAAVALVGLANEWDNRTQVWNEQVLQNPVSAQADAATIHLYAGLPSEPLTPDVFPKILASAAANFLGYYAYTNATIPSRMRLWVTEWGTFGNTAILNTWLQGLWHAALTLMLPTMARIDIILPYCAVCGDPAMPAFTSQYGPIAPPNATDAQWVRTASGHAYAQLFTAVRGAAAVAEAVFAPNPVLDPSVPSSRQLVGLVGMDGAHTVESLVFVNLGSTPLEVDISGLAFACGLQRADIYYPASLSDVVRQNIRVGDLGHSEQPVGGPFSVPAYAVAVVAC